MASNLKFRRATLFVYMEGVIVRLRRLNRVGTAKNYQAALNSFREFRSGADVEFGEMDCDLLEEYQLYLKQCGLAPNSISFYMRILRACYNKFVLESGMVDRHPFRTVFTGIEKTRKRAVSMADIKRIRALDCADNRSLCFARDIFLFLFYCRGMSFIDAAYLRKSDVHGCILEYRRHKTGQRLSIRIVAPIQELIDKYAAADSDYLLPIIRHAGCDERRQYSSALRRVNNSLSAISRMLDLPVPLTTYVARHSWATIANIKNVPIRVISDALGHYSISTTQIYLASVDAAEIDAANELIINDL